MTKVEMYKMEIERRTKEVEGYQLNIDNYNLALQIISAKSEKEQVEVAPFKEQLVSLLCSEKLEQNKSKIMLEVAIANLKALGG